MCLTQAGMAKKKRMQETEASKVVYVSNGNKISDELCGPLEKEGGK